jgi:hypothetical protein
MQRNKKVAQRARLCLVTGSGALLLTQISFPWQNLANRCIVNYLSVHFALWCRSCECLQSDWLWQNNCHWVDQGNCSNHASRDQKELNVQTQNMCHWHDSMTGWNIFMWATPVFLFVFKFSCCDMSMLKLIATVWSCISCNYVILF